MKTLGLAICLIAAPLWLQAQYMSGAMINSCGDEGANEYLFFKNTGGSFVASGSTIDVRYGTTSPPSTSYTDVISATGNPTFIASANSLLPSGCDFQFVNAPSGTTIPAGANFMVMDDSPNSAPNYSQLCGQGMGNIYVVFSSDASWSASGNFANSGTGSRHFQTTINGVTTTYNYAPNSLSGTNGDFIVWPPSGGSPGKYMNFAACAAPLPVKITYFKAIASAAGIQLTWGAVDEVSFSHFEVQRSDDRLISFQTVGHVKAAELGEYTFTDAPQPSLTYYRLKLHDTDGSTAYSRIIAAYPEQLEATHKVFPNPAESYVQLTLHDAETVEVISLTNGRIFKAETDSNAKLAVDSLPVGSYLVRWKNAEGKWATAKFVKN